MRRVVIPELLDSGAGTPEEIADSLRDLRLINRCFGGISTTRAMLERVVRATGRRELSLLDVAAGSGDIAAAVQRHMHARGVGTQVTLLDRKREHLCLGSECFAVEQRRIVADALALPLRDESFDVVTCALFTHHLEPEQLKAFVAEALRVSRVAVLINDLRRSAVSLALIYAGFPLMRSRLSRHDGVASVRRAYTPGEMRRMLRQAGVQEVEITRHYLFRMGLIAWKRPG